MKKVLTSVSLCVSAISLLGCTTLPQTPTRDAFSDTDTLWQPSKEILARIVAPTFSNREYVVPSDLRCTDQSIDARGKINALIATCSQAGGGTVVLRSGTFFAKGPVLLRSHVNLKLEAGATLKFTEDPNAYLPVVFTRWECTECYNYCPLIYARDAENIAITGSGTIDGNAEHSFGTWKKRQKSAQNRLRQMGADGVPVKERVFGKGHYLRPSMIQLLNCKNVLIEDVTIKQSPFWVTHPVYCQNVTIRGIKVKSWNANNDGVDVDSCADVLIEKCSFETGDDCVAIKSGRDRDGWRVNKPSKGIIIRDCWMNSRYNALACGSELSGGLAQIFMENCTVQNIDNALYFKSNKDRGGYIDGVYIRNIRFTKVGHLIRFTNNYHSYRGGNAPTEFKNVFIENVQCGKAEKDAISIRGLPEKPIHHIYLRDITIDKADHPHKIENLETFVCENVRINGEPWCYSENTPMAK